MRLLRRIKKWKAKKVLRGGMRWGRTGCKFQIQMNPVDSGHHAAVNYHVETLLYLLRTQQYNNYRSITCLNVFYIDNWLVCLEARVPNTRPESR